MGTQRNTWLGLVQGIGGLGAMVGYAVSGYITSYGVYYQWAFRIQGAWIICCIVILALAPTRLISASANGEASAVAASRVGTDKRSSMEMSTQLSDGSAGVAAGSARQLSFSP